MTLIEPLRPDGRKKILGLEQKLESVEHVKDLQRVGSGNESETRALRGLLVL